MTLGKVKDIIESKHFGKIIRTRSKRFGEGLYLVIKNNAKNWAEYVQFVKLPICNVLYWDSMKDDDVLEIRNLPEIEQSGD